MENENAKQEDGELESSSEAGATEPVLLEEALEGKGFGSILLFRREVIFQKIARGEELDAMILNFVKYAVLFAAIFGATLGFHALNLQILLSAIKSPLLILGTMAICLPALSTFNVLLGSRMSFKQTTAILCVATYTMATVLVSLAPIMLFFVISTNSKAFVLLLNVAAFGMAGAFGLMMLWVGMAYMTKMAGYTPAPWIIQIWSLIYMFVGTQLAWLLRPFVGNPGELVLFRNIEGNFYQAVFRLIIGVFPG